MCGITGWVNFKEDLSQKGSIVKHMNDQHAERGPDAEGFWFSKHCLFGHRRLSVMDPANGAQPMVKQFGERKLVVTFNGELYNMHELFATLKGLGYHFQTKCDTEILPVAYQEWRMDSPKHLNGIFAYAIWDEANEELFIARDRIGVKPLFYAQVGDSFLFGSELKSILAHPDVRPVIDEEGLAEVLMMGPARTPGVGVFKNVHELKAGHMLKFSRDGLKITPFWELTSDYHRDDFDTTVFTIRELFEQAVKRQLISDVPIGTMLSGGLDSSAISAYSTKVFQEEGRGQLTTFSVDYVDNDKHFQVNEFQPNSDAPWVKRMTEHIGSNHNQVLVDNHELFQTIIPAMRARDLPGMADIDASLVLFSREIKKKLTVCLSGECADEVFGGYPWFHREDLVSADIFPWAKRSMDRIPFITEEIQKRICPLEYVENRYQEALAEVPRLSEDNAKEARMREMFYLNLTRWMPTLLDRKDRMSMAVGLEVRVPFCDHHLVEYVWNVPWEMKNYNKREKGLLRHVLRGLLPDDVIERKKSPYPKTHHPDYVRLMKEQVSSLLVEKNVPLFQLLDHRAVHEFIEQDLSKIHLPWFGQLMNVPALLAYWVQLNAWLEEYKVEIE